MGLTPDLIDARSARRPLEACESLLFVPSGDAHRVRKAAAGAAHAVILDLEDGAGTDKECARSALAEAVALLHSHGKTAVVRINADLLEIGADLRASAAALPDALMCPKACSGDLLGLVDAALDRLHAGPQLRLIALVEQPQVLAEPQRLMSLLAAPRVCALALGSEDLAAAMQAPPTAELLAPALQALVVAARTRAGVRVYGMPHSIADTAGDGAWRRSAERARAMGVDGALCVHPRQLEAVHEAFGVTAADRQWAEEVVATALRQPERAVFMCKGQMVDAPVLARAHAILARCRPTQTPLSPDRQRTFP